MPNWAYSQYIATGDKEQLKKLYSIMSELEEMNARVFMKTALVLHGLVIS
ncbi:MAG: hypothetical protein HDR38_07125 [Treponema sp.]|nr:hypothetical protein [Treponema sp.]